MGVIFGPLNLSKIEMVPIGSNKKQWIMNVFGLKSFSFTLEGIFFAQNSKNAFSHW